MNEKELEEYKKKRKAMRDAWKMSRVASEARKDASHIRGVSKDAARNAARLYGQGDGRAM